MAHLKTSNSLRSSTTSNLATWSHCFLCSTHIPEAFKKAQSSRSRSSLISNSSGDFTILFKYLLHSCSDTLLQNSLLNCPPQQLSRIKLCSSCTKVAETIKEQHLLLEVSQLKIIDNLKTIKMKILSNSRNFGTNEEVQEAFQNFENLLEEKEKQGIPCDEERKLLELRFALENFIFEKNENEIQIPLVFLEKFVGANKTRRGGSSVFRLERGGKRGHKPQLSVAKLEPEIPSPPPIKEEVHQDYSHLEDNDEPFDEDNLPNDTNDPDFHISSESEEGECSRDADWEPETSSKNARLAPHRNPPVTDERPKARRGRPPSSVTAKESRAPKQPKIPPPIKEEVHQDYSHLEDNDEPFDEDNLPNETNDPDYHISSETEAECSDWEKETSPKKPTASVSEKRKRNHSKTKVHLCKMCDFTTTRVFLFEAHLREHETEEKPHPCSKCDLSFTTKQYFDLHQSLQHVKKRMRKCDLCEKMVLLPKLEDHILKDHGKDKIFSCHLCDHSYGTYLSLINHIERHSSGTTKVRRTKCLLCPEQDSGTAKEFTINSLRLHLVNCHEGFSDILITCEYPNCEQTFVDKTTYRFHSFEHEKRYVCQHCEKCFRNRYFLEKHMKHLHSGVKMKFECGLCEESFCQKFKLENHQSTEHGIGYECEYCVFDDEKGGKQRFATRQKLRTHRLAVHPETFKNKAERKLHQCSDCGKLFDVIGNLYQHRKIHIQTRDFTCEKCGFATKSARLLREHKLCHEDKTKFKCEHCPKTFRAKKYLGLHMVTHSEEKRHHCDICGRSFRQRSSFAKHKKRHLTNPTLHKHRGGDISHLKS